MQFKEANHRKRSDPSKASNEKRNIPFRFLWKFDAQHGFATLSEFGSLSHESQPFEIYVSAAENDNKSLLLADEIVIDDIPLQSS
jgi:hypothetical protein